MLARFVDKGRLNAILLVMLGVTIAPAFLLAGAAAALATLRRGLADGLLIAVAGWSVVAALIVGGGQSLPPPMGAMLVMLLAAVSLSLTLKKTGSLALTLVSGTAMALLALSLVWWSMDDPVGFWRQTFSNTLDQLIASGAEISEVDKQAFLDSLQFQAFTGNIIAMLMLLIAGSVFWGRSWQARLVNPGGFRREFQSLQLGRSLAAISAAIFMGAAVMEPGWLLNAAAIVIWLWVLQGLSVIHAIVVGLKASAGWLVATYVVLAFGWSVGIPVALVVPLLGLINQFNDLRAKVLRSSDNGE